MALSDFRDERMGCISIGLQIRMYVRGIQDSNHTTVKCSCSSFEMSFAPVKASSSTVNRLRQATKITRVDGRIQETPPCRHLHHKRQNSEILGRVVLITTSTGNVGPGFRYSETTRKTCRFQMLLFRLCDTQFLNRT